MHVKIGRRARRHIREHGGAATLEVVASTGCMVARDIALRAGAPDDPSGYDEVLAGEVVLFVRGELDGKPVRSVVPDSLAIRMRRGSLVAVS